ncbi:MAG TPA: hypothetical protein VGI39_39160 [Polyangiaceae bacterium]|jgi:hypothetical protein
MNRRSFFSAMAGTFAALFGAKAAAKPKPQELPHLDDFCEVCGLGPAAPEAPWDGTCLGGADCRPIPKKASADDAFNEYMRRVKLLPGESCVYGPGARRTVWKADGSVSRHD